VMTGPAPTTGQLWTGHVLVGVLATAIVHGALKDVKMTPNERLATSLLCGVVVAYAHHEFDAPVAKAIAKIAA
jgi:hypothetical protein